MLADFNVEVQDDSPRQVAKELVLLHDELLQGKMGMLQRLKDARQQAELANSMQHMVS